jgi:hypothetical protein
LLAIIRGLGAAQFFHNENIDFGTVKTAIFLAEVGEDPGNLG